MELRLQEMEEFKLLNKWWEEKRNSSHMLPFLPVRGEKMDVYPDGDISIERFVSIPIKGLLSVRGEMRNFVTEAKISCTIRINLTSGSVFIPHKQDRNLHTAFYVDGGVCLGDMVSRRVSSRDDMEKYIEEFKDVMKILNFSNPANPHVSWHLGNKTKGVFPPLYPEMEKWGGEI